MLRSLSLFSLTTCLCAFTPVPAGFTETLLASNLDRPVGLAFAPDGRLFVIEQYTGKIRILKNGSILSAPFATVSPVYTGFNETGLLGICIDPDFAANKYVYVFCTQSINTQRIIRYTAAGDTGINPTVIVDNIPSMGINHNGGGIGFGPDGKLYASVGENGSFTEGDSQNLASKRGKLLRYNRDGTIPSDNPFGSANPAFCYGLRNSFRFCFQPGTGRIFASENGPNENDEINILKAGRNYGWPNVTGVSTNPGYENPILVFPATIAITGIAFYNSSVMPFNGSLFYCAYKTDKIVRLTLSGQTVASSSDFVTEVDQLVDLAVGPDGAIYFCTLPGRLYRVKASGAGNQAPYASFTASPASGPAPLNAMFNGSSSNDLDGFITSYAWAFGDGSSAGGVTATHVYANPGTYTVTLTVTDNTGATGTTTQTVVASVSGNPPPAAHIESATPTTGRAPLAVQFAGHGHDDTNVVQHSWNFGDNTPVVVVSNPGVDTNSTPSHTFQTTGTYLVTLTVTDTLGQTATNQVTITVNTGCGLTGVEPLVLFGLIALLRRRRR